MVFSIAPTTFLGVTACCPEFNPVASIKRGPALGRLAHPAGAGRLGSKPAFWFAELVSASRLGPSHSDFFVNGLCLLVVALGEPHGPVLLAVSQCSSHRSRHGRQHGV